MDDLGFQGTGSRFNTRFGAGDDIYASQLNGLASGIQSALGMPYLGAGQSVSFVPGGNIITGPSPVENAIGAAINFNFGEKYVNHYQIQVGTMFLDSVLIPTPILKVAKGGNVYRPEDSACATNNSANDIYTDGSLAVIPGIDPTSVWASNDGYIIIEPGTTYFVYALKMETAINTQFFIYVSTSAAVVFACPVALPDGIPDPGIPYDLQGVMVGQASYTLPFFPYVLQSVVGSIGWPNLPGAAATEYVNHYEVKYESILIDDVATDIVRIGRGGNIWNPSTEANRNALEHRVDVITSDGSVPVVTGDKPDSPWASNGGWIIPYAEATTYVYAFKITYNAGNSSDFYIYAATSGTLLNTIDGKIPLPEGLEPAPAPDYTVQGLMVAEITWNGLEVVPAFSVNQHVVGSITWPGYIKPYKPQPLEVIVEQESDLSRLRIAKGDILWATTKFANRDFNADYVQNYTVQGQAKKVWVYPDGTIYNGDEPDSPWVNNGGWVQLDTTKSYGVYIVGNQDAYVGGQYGNVALAVIEDGSDAETKSRPFREGLMGRIWVSVATPFLEVDGSPYGLGGISESSNWIYNFNCQRYLVAKVYFSETAWVVEQRLLGPVTLPDDLIYSGLRFWEGSDPPGPPFEQQYADEQEAWIGSWGGHTKDGSPDTCTIVVRPFP